MNSYDDHDRQTGRTTQQILEAPRNAIYIWVNGMTLDYPRRIAMEHGRSDMEFMAPHVLTNGRLHGMNRLIIADHAARFSGEELRAFEAYKDRLYASGVMTK